MLQLEYLNHKDTSQLIMKTFLNVVSTNLSHVMTHVHLTASVPSARTLFAAVYHVR